MVDIDMRYNECLLPNREISEITARMVARYVESPFGLYCDLFASLEEREPIHPYLQLLMERGQEHEEDTVQEEYPEAAREEYETLEEGFKFTIQMMAEGEKFIFTMPCIYLPLGMKGIPDVLVRCEGAKSIFGNYYYTVVEIKLAKNIKNYHVIQGSYYNRLVGKIQGYEPAFFLIENGEDEVFEYDMRSNDHGLDEAINGIQMIIAGEKVAPCYGACPWPWQTYGNNLAINNRDVSLITGVGPSIQSKMKGMGLNTIDDVYGVTLSDLQKVHGIGPKKANDFKTKVEALIIGMPLKRESNIFAFPHDCTELFLDLEGTDPRLQEEGLAVCNYLIGIVHREGGKYAYIPFVAHSPEEEKDMLLEFCRYIDKIHNKYIIYHWQRYERTNISKMMEYYNISPTMRDKVLGKLVDLSPIAVKSYAFPTYGDGLKEIANYLGFSWRQSDVDAMTSVVLYQNYVQSGGQDEEALAKISIYNEDDCLATMHIKDWLTSNYIGQSC